MNISELISWLSLIIRDLETAAAEYGVNHTDIVHEATQLQVHLCRGKQVTTPCPECPVVGCQNAPRGAVWPGRPPHERSGVPEQLSEI